MLQPNDNWMASSN